MFTPSKIDEQIMALSPYTRMEKASVKRAKIYLETGIYPHGEYSLTWDLLAYCDEMKKTKTE